MITPRIKAHLHSAWSLLRSEPSNDTAMPRVVSESESEPDESGSPSTLLQTITTIRERKSQSLAVDSDGDGAESNNDAVASPVAGPSKAAKSTAKNGQEQESQESEDEDDDDEEVYVVEKVVRHVNSEEDGIVYYEIKWKGYPTSENTWEPEDNLDGARDLLEKYFERIGGHPSEVGDVQPKKRGRKSAGVSTSPPPKKPKAEAGTRSGRGKKQLKVEPDDDIKWPDVKVNSDWAPPKPRKDAWEDILLEVDTMQVDANGVKWAFVLWSVEDENGKKRTSRVLLSSASIAAPQAVIRFFEKHLVFTKSKPES